MAQNAGREFQLYFAPISERASGRTVNHLEAGANLQKTDPWNTVVQEIMQGPEIVGGAALTYKPHILYEWRKSTFVAEIGECGNAKASFDRMSR